MHLAFVSLMVVSPAAGELASSALTISYDFDSAELPTGPDTFTVVQQGEGTVRLSDVYRFNGNRSLEIRDVPGDGTSPDFLGHLPLQRKGQLFVHFAWMSPDPNENMNIGLLGPEWCRIVKDGISFWLTMNHGVLHHVSDKASRPIFRPKPGHWYIFDLDYDIGRGRYDLLVQDEHGEVIAEVRDAPNPAGVPESAVFKFSFTGDLLEDASNSVYYVDDIILSVTAGFAQPPFVAPGRRQLFFDRWGQFHAQLRERPGCLQPIELADLGFTPRHVGALHREGLLDTVTGMLGGRPGASAKTQAKIKDEELSRLLSAVRAWEAGCNFLAKKKPQKALRYFRTASEQAPAARLYPISEVMAHAGLGHWDVADDRLAEVYGAWLDDDRLPAVMASLGLARGDLEQARDWLQDPAEELLETEDPNLRERLLGGSLDPRVVAEVKKLYPERWRDPIRETLVADQYFFSLLWSEREREAEQYAYRLAHRQHELSLPVWKWMERAADAAFALGKFDVAQHRYEVALHLNPYPASPLLKLADVHHVSGDYEKEREYREMVYGSLGEH